VPKRLVEQYRRAPVKHADETTWRNDGGNGYAWLFATKDMSLFRFRPTRSASVAREVFGPKRLKGVLLVDRYAGYNKAPCKIQYCYAHLLRDVQDLEKEFPDQPEVAAFVRPLVVARKVSFGSQSDRGAATRETLMTVLHTLRKRTADPAAAFKAFLDRLADQPEANRYRLLFATPPPNVRD